MQCAVWTHLVVVLPPELELVAHVGEREEDLDVQAFIAQPPVKRLDVSLLYQLDRSNEVQLHADLIRRCVHRPTSKFSPVIHGDRHWRAALSDYLRKRRRHLVPS